MFHEERGCKKQLKEVMETRIKLNLGYFVIQLYISFQFIGSCFCTGPSKRGRQNSLPGTQALLRRVQVPQMQKEMDVGQFVVKHGPGMHKMSHQRVSAQAEAIGKARRTRRFGSVQGASSTFVPKMQGVGILLQEGSVIPILIYNSSVLPCYL